MFKEGEQANQNGALSSKVEINWTVLAYKGVSIQIEGSADHSLNLLFS